MVILQFAIAAEVGAALVSGAAHLLGGLFGNKSTSDTNKTNLQIAREQNQFNLEQWERERDFTVDQWNRQNAYNDPSAQKSRLLNAGINPYLADIDVGNAGSATTPSGSPAAGATMQPKNFDYIGDSVASGVNQYIGLKMADAQIEQMKEQNDLIRTQVQANNIANLFSADKLKAEIDATSAAAGLSRWTADRHRQDYIFKNALFPSEYREQLAQTEEKEMGITAMGFKLGMQAIELELAKANLAWLPREKAQQLRVLIAQEAMYNASGAASYSQVGLNKALSAESLARKAGIELDNIHKPEMNKLLITAQKIANQQAWYERELTRKQNSNYNTDKWFNRVGTVVGLGSNVAVGFGAGAHGLKALRDMRTPVRNPIGFR